MNYKSRFGQDGFQKAFEAMTNRLSEPAQYGHVDVEECCRMRVREGHDTFGTFKQAANYIAQLRGERDTFKAQCYAQASRIFFIANEMHILKHPQGWRQRLATLWRAIRP